MALRDNLEQDIHQFFMEIEDMLPESKKKHLALLVDKYCHISATPVKFDRSDFDMIKSFAHRDVIDRASTVYLGEKRREIHSSEIAMFRIVEATISYLYSKDCLKKMPTFDYRND